MDKTAKLTVGDQSYELPVYVGSEDEVAVDISKLRAQSKVITLDPGFANTGACTSAITYLDGEQGILRYRGIPIEQLAETSSFIEVAYLLIYGELPSRAELNELDRKFDHEYMLHESMLHFFDSYPPNAHPMLILSAMVASLCSYYPHLAKPVASQEEVDMIVIQLLSKVSTISAFSYKKFHGEPVIYPKPNYSYIGNFLHMMFSKPNRDYEINPVVEQALRVLLILHADHEQNCSTSTVRLVGSSQANLFASVSAGIAALWGPLHGGANQKVVEMLEMIRQDDCNYKKYIAKAKDKDDPFRLMGFGHRVYKNFDPRAKIIKKQCDLVLDQLGVQDPLLDIAKEFERVALEDPYFVERKLYPNVDFYSGIIYRAIGIPLDMFPVMFAIGRMPGWIAHWKEMVESPSYRIGRPRQVYTGYNERAYVPLEKRS